MAAGFPCPYEWGVEPELAHVPIARRTLLDVVRFWQLPLSEDTLSDVALCAGEIIANAIEHTGARCKVTVRWTGTTLRVEVRDPSMRPPEVIKPRNNELRGRGLALVDALSLRWGWLPAGTGKTVWFECAPTDPAPHGCQPLPLTHRSHS